MGKDGRLSLQCSVYYARSLVRIPSSSRVVVEIARRRKTNKRSFVVDSSTGWMCMSGYWCIIMLINAVCFLSITTFIDNVILFQTGSVCCYLAYIQLSFIIVCFFYSNRLIASISVCLIDFSTIQ
jgi:exosortase/archaeosortase